LCTLLRLRSLTEQLLLQRLQMRYRPA
jgi:hypothetical protein